MRAVARLSTCLAVAVLAIGGLAAPASSASDTVRRIVVLESGPSGRADVAAEARALTSRYGGRPVGIYGAVLGAFTFEGPEEALEGIRRSAGVAAVVEETTSSLADDAGWGIFRIDADDSLTASPPFEGAASRVAVIDSGIDVDHPDLAPNLDLANSYDCYSNDPDPDDDNGHGTHVAGVIAAAWGGGQLVGVAPRATVVAMKAFGADGQASTSNLLCAFDRLATLTAADPMPTTLNMSFGESGSDSDCDDGDVSDLLHEAICDLVASGRTAGVPVVPVAAAGNGSTDASTFIPAAFDDVITVSAMADFDGTRGGLQGCVYQPEIFNYECDDTIASFSNFGPIDVMAPGVAVYSTYPGSGYTTLSGTSMAAPHVTGVVAVMLGENASLDTAGTMALLRQTGECPDGTTAGDDDDSCTGQGDWLRAIPGNIFSGSNPKTGPDPDGVAEPLVNAMRAAQVAASTGEPADRHPTVSIGAPTSGTVVSGLVVVSGTAGDDGTVVGVELLVDGSPVGGAALNGSSWSLEWDTSSFTDGSHVLTAVATDDRGHRTTSTPVTVDVDNSVPPPTPTEIHVGSLLGTASAGRRWTATATATVLDSAGKPMAGVEVQWSVGSATLAGNGSSKGGPGSGGGSGTLSCVTDAQGRCSVSVKPTTSSVRFTVTRLLVSGFTWDQAADNDADPSTEATDLVVVRPG